MKFLKKIKEYTNEMIKSIINIFKVKDHKFKGTWVHLNRMFILMYFALLIYIGFIVNLGFGKGIDLLAIMSVGTAIFFFGKILLVLCLAVVKKIPLKFLINFVAVLLVFAYALDKSLSLNLNESIIISLAIVLPQICLMYAIIAKKNKVLSSIIIVICLLVDVGYSVFLFRDTHKDEVAEYVETVLLDKDLEIVDPSLQGPYTVKTLSYGSGKHKWREEYGKEVDILTDPVNASSFMWNLEGMDKFVRENYWGFDRSEVPLNAMVYYPEEEGVYPLVLIVHGNHDMIEESDKGYEYLGNILASKGYIVASVDENFINGSWSGGASGGNDARAWILLKHLELWEKWNEEEDSVFSGKVDMENIGLIGHSRGGEAVALAALFNELDFYPGDSDIKFDFNFNIESVIAIAPTDGQYKPGGKYATPQNIDYLLMQGAADGDVDEFLGIKMFDRIKFTDDEYHIKSALYIDGANHGQFNTKWIDDSSFPDNLLINKENIISKEDQMQIAKVYIGGFLDYSLKEQSQYLDMFKNYSYALQWLPQIKYMNRFQDSKYEIISNFDEDFDLDTMTLSGGTIEDKGISYWREREMKLRGGESTGNSAAYLRWNDISDEIESSPQLKFNLPENFSTANYEEIVFDIGDSGRTDLMEEGIKFTVGVEDINGNKAIIGSEQYSMLWNTFRTRFTKLEWTEDSYEEYDTVLQSYLIPLNDFKTVNNEIDLNNIKKISMIFNEGSGEVIFDNLGFKNK